MFRERENGVLSGGKCMIVSGDMKNGGGGGWEREERRGGVKVG